MHCAIGMKARGWRVFATARKPEDLPGSRPKGLRRSISTMRSRSPSPPARMRFQSARAAKLDALFNNGAYGQPGAVEDLTREVLEAQFAANFFGWHQLTRECMPLMRANGSGRIVQCSSVLGLVALKWRGAYNASKFAPSRRCPTRCGWNSVAATFMWLIEPGPITSRFVETLARNLRANIDEANSHYKEAYERQRARLGRGGSGRYKLGPEAVLEKLIHAVEADRPSARYYVTTPTRLHGDRPPRPSAAHARPCPRQGVRPVSVASSASAP
jgi:NAD(P)-dependent dehydrogenase (short-subunit alcohol dehydrogenase family)